MLGLFFFCGCVVILKLGLHGDRKSTVYERSALAELLAGVAPRLSDYHGLANIRNPVSSSYYPSADSSA